MADMQRESNMRVWDGVRDDVQVVAQVDVQSVTQDVVQTGKSIRNQFSLLRNIFLKNE